MTQVSTGETEIVAKKPETTTEHEKIREKKERVRPPTKVVIRRLPPTLTKESFINQISPLPDHDFLYFVRPDKSLGPFAFSRAYINFIKQEDIFTFKEQFDNYTFMDKKGNEYPAVVEFAPFQRLPKKRMGRKKDPKMGTLEQDPAYVSFVESRAAKSAESSSAQHCPLEYFPPPEKKKITTTPLLDFLRQRKAERQRMRDERREERRRKEQERKRLKDAERDRRRGTTGKPDTSTTRDSASDSVLKVLRNPEHEKEAKDDSNRGAGSKENREKIQPGTKKREDDRHRNTRDKERERKEKQLQENRQRENKGQSSVKSYRDDRQKQMELRAQRKLPDDQRKKTSFERGHVKAADTRQKDESDKSQTSSKTSDTRRSQEFDRSSSKSSDTRRSQEFERSQGSTKISDSRKTQDHERQTHSNRDTDHRKHYQSNDQRRTQNERFQNHAKDNEKQNKENEHRKSYKDMESRRGERNQGYNKDVDQKRNSYNMKTPRNYGDSERKYSGEHRINAKEDQKQSKDPLEETIKEEETKKWEQMGAKPKRKTSDIINKQDSRGEKIKEQTVKTEKIANKSDSRNSSESTEQKATDNNVKDQKEENSEKNTKDEAEEQQRFLDAEVQKLTSESVHEESSKNEADSAESKKQDSVESEEISKTENLEEKKVSSRPVTEHKYGARPSKRRGSLDSGDHESEVQSSEGMSRSATGSDWSMDTKLKRNHSLDLGGNRWDIDGGHGDGIGKSSERSIDDSRKGDRDDKDMSGSGGDGEQKRDPRAERRIRNKDRPSIEIYRPGMGRFSLQRKEREKSSGSASGTAGSSMEQESPSSSPSPTPTNSNRIVSSTKASKSGNELRSMTFKRSVSREK